MTLDGEEILNLTGLERVRPHEELADEYSVRAVPEADSGIVVYGRFGTRWEANPGLRPVVRELCGRLNGFCCTDWDKVLILGALQCRLEKTTSANEQEEIRDLLWRIQHAN